MTYLSNAFSLNMLSSSEDFTLIRARKVEPSEVPETAMSVIGHTDTARVLSAILAREVPASRKDVVLNSGDILYVAQYKGPRLPEGATQLPEGSTLEFLEITLKSKGCSGCPACNCYVCTTMCWLHGYGE